MTIRRAFLLICADICGAVIWRQSGAKFKRGTGWSSFTAFLDNVIEIRANRKFLAERSEVLCPYCGSHRGPIFSDGSASTGKRYCLNGLALEFTATAV